MALVVEIIDGDTIDVRFAAGDVTRVRLPQVDAPEIDECGYEEATDVLEELTLGLQVELVATDVGPGTDQYGRLLRAVELKRSQDVGAILVRSGAVRWESRYATEDRRLAAIYESAEAEARREQRGSWSACDWS